MAAKIISALCQPIAVDQRHAERREQELAERAGRGAGAERESSAICSGTSLPNAATTS